MSESIHDVEVLPQTHGQEVSNYYQRTGDTGISKSRSGTL